MKTFQFLLVRLKDNKKSGKTQTENISIPSGTIKRLFSCTQ